MEQKHKGSAEEFIQRCIDEGLFVDFFEDLKK